MSARAWLSLCAVGLSLLSSCADRATIGALCPVGCVPRPEASICDCSPTEEPRDAGAPDAGSTRDAGAQTAAADSGSQACVLPRALDLLVVFDDSASLSPWYVPVYDGFRAFIRDEDSQGIGMGLLRFGDSCDVSGYLPLMVPVAELPENISAIDAALPNSAFSVNSTLPALEAVEQYAQRWAADHPGTWVSVLLITDASPGACDGLNSMYDVEAPRLAGAARAGSPAIDTYVVAPGSFELADSIARSGGTELQRLPVTATSDDMLAALRVVRAAAMRKIAPSAACDRSP